MQRWLEIPSGTLIGFKALPIEEAATLNLHRFPHGPQDWVAVYPQLTLQSALAYLPNQWDNGVETAQIVTLTTRKTLSLLVYMDKTFADVSVDSSTKAQRVRIACKAASELPCSNLSPTLPLMDACGALEFGLCVLDADDFELVIPHVIFNREYFDVAPLFTFHQSTQIRSTIGSIDGFHLQRRVLMDLDSVYEQIEQLASVTRCEFLIESIHDAIK